MAIQETFTGMGRVASLKLGMHRVDISQENAPLEMRSFKAVFWFNNGVEGSREVNGFPTMGEALAFARSTLPDGFLASDRT